MIKNKYKLSTNHLFLLNPKRCRNYFLIQAGEALCANDTIIPIHQQNYFEITYVVSGKGVSYVNDTSVSLKKNDCFFSFPNETHKIISDKDEPLRFIFLSFYAKQKTQGNAFIHDITRACQHPNNRNYQMEHLHPLCLNILQELRDEDGYSERAIALLLEQILIECSRTISKKTKIALHTTPTNAAILTHDIITYIDQNIFNIKKLSDLEEVFFYNVNNLAKAFHAEMGIPLNAYFISKKMETALQLLQSGESVTQVSDKLQYSSIHAFSRAYKNHFNENPSISLKKYNPEQK